MAADEKRFANKVQLRKHAYQLVAERLTIAALNGDFDLEGLSADEVTYVLDVITNEVAPHFRKFESE